MWARLQVDCVSVRGTTDTLPGCPDALQATDSRALRSRAESGTALALKGSGRFLMDSFAALLTASAGLALGIGLARLALAAILALTFDRH